MKLISWQGWPLQREKPLGFVRSLDHAAPQLRNWPIRQVPAADVLHEVLIVYPAVDVRPYGRASAGGALNLQTSAEPLDAFPHALYAKMTLLHPLLGAGNEALSVVADRELDAAVGGLGGDRDRHLGGVAVAEGVADRFLEHQ